MTNTESAGPAAGRPPLGPAYSDAMLKPVGAACNLACEYCYYRPGRPGIPEAGRMGDDILEGFFAGFLTRATGVVTIGWQGGEPTLAGIDFFERALAVQRRFQREGQKIFHALQTNGTLLDDDWGRFLSREKFLVGLSLDGAPDLHDRHRKTPAGAGSSEAARRGLEILRRHRVETNPLCVVSVANVKRPEETLLHLLNLGLNWVQFIPAIEWEVEQENDVGAGPCARPRAQGDHGGAPLQTENPENTNTAETAPRRKLAPFSPSPSDYADFLKRTFDLWFERFRGRVRIRDVDAWLETLACGTSPSCVFGTSCHDMLTVESDGSIYPCDHAVGPGTLLGRIGEGAKRPDGEWPDRLDLERLAAFRARKSQHAADCQTCPVFPLCHGGCPKHRAENGPANVGAGSPRPHGTAPGKTVLCPAYRAFFDHARERLEWIAGYIRRGEIPPPPKGAGMDSASPTPAPPSAAYGRNDPCPCGSGLKLKRCHGKAVIPPG